MQPVESVSVTRRAMDIEDYIDVMRRHKSWILGPAFASLVAGFVVAFLWPDTYVSTALIRVVPPQVPESLVQTNLNMDMTSHIMAMAQTILSRSNLTTMINTLNLYPKERANMPLDDVVEKMQKKDVSIGEVQNQEINGHGSVTAFQISFKYYNRLAAQKVTEDLTAKFISENIKDRTNASNSTTQFLSEQFMDAKKQLDDCEQRLSDFRVKNMGRLPDEMQSNLAQLNGMQVQMTTMDQSVGRINQDKLLLENQLSTLKSRYNSLAQAASGDGLSMAQKNEKIVEQDRQIAQLENALAVLRERYKDEHPDVQRTLSLLATAKKQREALVKEEAEKQPEAAPVRRAVPMTRDLLDINDMMKRTQAEIAAKDLEMAERKKEIAQLTEAARVLQTRIEGVPVGEKEYDELIRDRNAARQLYDDLNTKLEISKRSTALANRGQAETLELLDPASLPQTPTEPKRPVIIAVAAAIGLAVGLMLAGAREVKNTSLKNLKDVRAYTRMPVLGSIPLLENDLVVRRRRRLSWLAWSTACLIGAVIMSGSVVYYYATKV